MPITRHSAISYVKSIIRICAYVALPFALPTSIPMWIAAGLLTLAEGFGIWEEIGATY